jgi:hypothetical protein
VDGYVGNVGMVFEKLMMRWCFISLPPLFVLSTGFAQADDAGGRQDAKEPRYVAEAPLPKGWPKPGPYGEVVVKEFPAYRAAYTPGWSSTFAFWRLFNHIKRQEIPMTAPVEMGMGRRGGKGDKLGMKYMGFLYQHGEVGDLGKDGKRVEVFDMPAVKALSYTWQGPRNGATIKTAKQAVDKALKERGLKSSDYRVLGYNGPGVADAKKTWEMLLVLPAKAEAKP